MEIARQQSFDKSKYILFRYIIMAGLVAGTSDALAAIFILSHGNAPAIFKYISSGIYGKEAFTGGEGMVQLGVALHYFIAFALTIFYFTIFKYATVFHRNIFISTIVYGLFIYLVMNVMVSSLSNVHIVHRNMTGILKNTAILMVCIALPIVCFKRAYDSKCLKYRA